MSSISSAPFGIPPSLGLTPPPPSTPPLTPKATTTAVRASAILGTPMRTTAVHAATGPTTVINASYQPLRHPMLIKPKHAPVSAKDPLSINPTPITAEDEFEFKNIYSQAGPSKANYNLLVKAAEKDFKARGRLVSKLVDGQIIQHAFAPFEIDNFVNDKLTYTGLLKLMTQESLMDKNLDAALGYYSFTGDPKDWNGEFNKRNERIAQLKAIMDAYNSVGKLSKLQFYLDQDEELRKVFQLKDIGPLLIKEKLQRQSPDRIAKRYLQSAKKYGLDATQIASLKEVAAAVEKDIVARENDTLDAHDFQTRTQFWLNRISEIMESSPEMVNRAIAEKITPLQQARNQNTNLLYTYYLGSMTDINIFNKQIKMIKNMISKNPNNQVAKKLDALTDKIVTDMKAGTISVSEAFEKINSMRKNMQPIIDKTTGEVDLRKLRGVYEAAIEEKVEHEPYDSKTADPNKYYYEPLRNVGFIAEPNLDINDFEFKGGEKAEAVGKGAYALDLNQKQDLWNAIQDLYNTPFTVHTNVSSHKLTLNQIDWKPSTTSLKAPKDNKAQKQLLEEVIKKMSELKINISSKTGQNIFNYKRFNTKAASHWHAESIFKAFVNEFTPTLENLVTSLERDLKNNVGKPNLKDPNIFQLLGSTSAAKTTSTTIPIKSLKILPKPYELHPTTKIIETAQQKAEREKKYATGNIKYSKKLSKEEPELHKSYHGKNIIEYQIKNEADLIRMRHEVMSKPGKLYIIDLATGRLYPIDPKEAIVGKTYIYRNIDEKTDTLKMGHKGGAFAYYPAIQKIHRDQDDLFPYEFMKEGRDKSMFRLHQIARKPDNMIDYRDQIRQEMGGSLWEGIKKAYHSMSKLTGPVSPGHNLLDTMSNAWLDKTKRAAVQLGQRTLQEGKNFIAQEKGNIQRIGQANQQFYRHPSLKNFGQAYQANTGGIVKVLAQPNISSWRQTANLSDFASDVPGLNIVKAGAQYAIPPLAVIDALSKAVRSSGVGSNDKTNYLDTAISLGDAILGSGGLKGNYETGAKLLSGATKIADTIIDKHS